MYFKVNVTRIKDNQSKTACRKTQKKFTYDYKDSNRFLWFALYISHVYKRTVLFDWSSFELSCG